MNAEAEYFEAGGVDAVTRALQIDEGEVLKLGASLHIIYHFHYHLTISWYSWSSNSWHNDKDEVISTTHGIVLTITIALLVLTCIQTQSQGLPT